MTVISHIFLFPIKLCTFQDAMKLNLIFLFFYLQGKPKKEGPMSVEEAVEDSENLTDFLLDFEEDENSF